MTLSLYETHATVYFPPGGGSIQHTYRTSAYSLEDAAARVKTSLRRAYPHAVEVEIRAQTKLDDLDPTKTTEEALKEARKKAAAPDLLFALKGFVEEYDNDPATWPDDMVGLLKAGHAAIRKAETGI